MQRLTHTLVLSLFLGLVSIPLFAQDLGGCLKIKQDKPRLTCYDRTAKELVEAQKIAELERRKAEAELQARRIDPNTLQPEQKVQVEKALKQLNKLYAATEVGISLRDYGTRIVDMSAEFKEAIRAIPAGNLRKELERALADHIVAREIWSAMIEAGYAEVFEKVYCSKLIQDYNFKPCRITGDWNSRTRSNPVSSATKLEVLNTIWAASKAHAKVAEDLLAKNQIGVEVDVAADQAAAVK